MHRIIFYHRFMLLFNYGETIKAITSNTLWCYMYNQQFVRYKIKGHVFLNRSFKIQSLKPHISYRKELNASRCFSQTYNFLTRVMKFLSEVMTQYYEFHINVHFRRKMGTCSPKINVIPNETKYQGRLS